MRRQIQKAYPLTTAWQKLEPADHLRVGLIVQNRSTNADSIIISEGRPIQDMAGIEITPAGDLYEDILPAQGELWARTIAGAFSMTVVLKY